MNMLSLARRARMHALLHRHLSNATDVWRAQKARGLIPPLRFRSGLTLHHGPGDAPIFLFFEIFANGCYRLPIVPPTGGTVVDIGANIGAFTLDCAARYPQVTIEAYEPNPIAYRVLEQNVRANRLEHRVRIYAEAVGRAPGVLKLWGTSGTVIATAYPDAAEAAAAPVECPMVDLATVFGRTDRRVELVKIDVEGPEADILEGGSAVLRGAEQFVGEYHEWRVPGVLDRCRGVFEASGFTFASACTARCGPLFYARRAG